MAFACSVAINFSRMYRHHIMRRDVQTVSSAQEQQMHFGISSSQWRGSTRRRRPILSEMTSETVEETGTDPMKEKDASEKGDQSGDPKASPAFASNPFMAGKISSRIAARSVDTSTNGKSKAPNMVPPTATATSPTSPFSQQISPVSSPPGPQRGADKLNRVKPNVFLESRAGGFKELGPRNLMDTLKEPKGRGATRFGQPIVPTNLFDEPKKPAQEEKFEFSLTVGQLVIIGSFLTIISIMFGTAFLVWKVGAIHFNEY